MSSIRVRLYGGEGGSPLGIVDVVPIVLVVLQLEWHRSVLTDFLPMISRAWMFQGVSYGGMLVKNVC